ARTLLSPRPVQLVQLLRLLASARLRQGRARTACRHTPMKRLVTLLCMLCLAAPAAAAWDINQLMNDLARRSGGRATFVEKKYLAVLDKPLVSSGELSFTAAGRLEKRTLKPKPELISLDNDILTVEHGDKKFTLRLSSRPEAVAFVDSV